MKHGIAVIKRLLLETLISCLKYTPCTWIYSERICKASIDILIISFTQGCFAKQSKYQMAKVSLTVRYQ